MLPSAIYFTQIGAVPKYNVRQLHRNTAFRLLCSLDLPSGRPESYIEVGHPAASLFIHFELQNLNKKTTPNFTVHSARTEENVLLAYNTRNDLIFSWIFR